MNKILSIIFSGMIIHSTTVAQTIDSVRTQLDSVKTQFDSVQTQKDSVVRIVPIPEIGSIEPFSNSSQSISTKEITFREYRSLYDIISREPGVFVRDLASPGQQNQIIIHGIDDKNIALLVDGIPYNDYYTGSYNLWNIPVDAIERVEFISGTSAIFYDGKSAGGVLNIVTKNFNNNRAMTNLRYSQGISGYAQTDVMFAQNVMTGVNLSFGLAHYGFGSNKEGQNFRARFYNSNDDAWHFRSKVRYNVSNWMNLSFAYSYDRRWTGLHGGVDLFNTPSVFDGLNAEVKNLESYEKQYNSHYNLTAAYYPFQDSTLLTTLSLYSFDRLREYRDEENRNLIQNGIFTRRDFASIGRGMKLNILSQYSRIRFIGYVDLMRVQSTDVITAGLKSEIFPKSALTISPFISFKDYQSQFIINGGVEGILRVSSSIQLYGGIIQNLIEDQPSTTTSNAALFTYLQKAKETFSIIQVGSRFTLTSFFSGEISYKRTEQKNLIIFDTVDYSQEGGKLLPTRYSFDAISASAHLEWNDFHLEGTANYLKQPGIERNNILLILYPELTLNGSVYYHGLLANGNLDLKIGLRGNFYSKQTGMRPYDEYGVWIPSSDLEYGPSGTMDFFAIGKIGDAYIHLIWENLTGTQYLLAPVYPMYDRNIRFGLSWEFLD